MDIIYIKWDIRILAHLIHVDPNGHVRGEVRKDVRAEISGQSGRTLPHDRTLEKVVDEVNSNQHAITLV